MKYCIIQVHFKGVMHIVEATYFVLVHYGCHNVNVAFNHYIHNYCLMIIKFILSDSVTVLLVGRRYFDILRGFTYPNISSVMESNLVFEFVS